MFLSKENTQFKTACTSTASSENPEDINMLTYLSVFIGRDSNIKKTAISLVSEVQYEIQPCFSKPVP